MVKMLRESSLGASGQTVAGSGISSTHGAFAAPQGPSGPVLASGPGPVALALPLSSVTCLTSI